MSGRTKLYRMKRSIIKIFERYTTTPKLIKNWRLWAFRRAVSPWFSISLWALSLNGERYYLGNDPIDDLILVDVLQNHRHLYLPDKVIQDKDFLILDIGAHHGIVAVSMLLHFPKSFLIAVEPNPDAHQYLRRNLEANQLTIRVEIVKSALSAFDGVGILSKGNKGSWSDTVVTDAKEASGDRVATNTITSILQGRQPNLIKCNAEGAEYHLFPELFSQAIYPAFVILMAHPEFGSVDDLVFLFQRHGYQVVDVASGHHRPRLHCYLEDSPLLRRN